MIIRYNSKFPGTPPRTWDANRTGFEIIDTARNRWRISDLNHPSRHGFHIMTVEDSQAGLRGLTSSL